MAVKVSEVYREVKRLARRYPLAKYDIRRGFTCFYNAGEVEFGPREEGCIIGQAFRGLGIEVPSSLEGKRVRTVVDTLVSRGKLENDEEKLIFWLDEVQRQQDIGNRWRKAVKKANRYASW